MRTKIIIIGLCWLAPIACWFGASSGDRVFAVAAGAVFAILLSVFFALQPMLKCGVCGATTEYFANYSQNVAKLHGNWKRYFKCGSCGHVIDRATGMRVQGIPDTPVVCPSGPSSIGCAIAGVGGLLVFGAVVIAAVALMASFSIATQPERIQFVLLMCGLSAAVGILMMVASRFISV